MPLFKPLPPTPIHGVGIKTLLTHLPSTVTDTKGPRRAGMGIPTCGGIAKTRLSLGGAVLLCPLRHGGPVPGQKAMGKAGLESSVPQSQAVPSSALATFPDTYHEPSFPIY